MTTNKFFRAFVLVAMVTCLSGTGCSHKQNVDLEILKPGSIKFKVIIK